MSNDTSIEMYSSGSRGFLDLSEAVDGVVLAVRLAFAVLFVWTGVSKLRRRRHFRASLESLGLSHAAVVASAATVPVLELCLGLGLLVVRWQPYPEIASAAVLLGFSAVLSWLILAGKTGADCGCVPWRHDASLSPVHALVNVGLALLVATAGTTIEPTSSVLVLGVVLLVTVISIGVIVRMIAQFGAHAVGPEGERLEPERGGSMKVGAA